jgi:uncharacterized membrane protein (DUF2068 family)
MTALSIQHTGQGSSTPPRYKGLLIIGVFKLVKALLLIAIAIGALSMLHKNLETKITNLIFTLRGDPDNHYLNLLLHKVTGADDRKLKEISLGTFIYAALFLTEGTGLLLRKRWGEYFTVIITGSFIPFEIYELVRNTTTVKIVAVVINLAILWYLIVQLRHRDRPG